MVNKNEDFFRSTALGQNIKAAYPAFKFLSDLYLIAVTFVFFAISLSIMVDDILMGRPCLILFHFVTMAPFVIMMTIKWLTSSKKSDRRGVVAIRK